MDDPLPHNSFASSERLDNIADMIDQLLINSYLILKKYVTLSTISFYNMNALGIGQMIL